MNDLIYGHNADERIVAVYQKDDRTMRICFRTEGGVRYEDAEFYPFFYLARDDYLHGFKRKHWVKQLDGTNFYRYLCVFDEWPTMWEAIRFVLDRHNHVALQKVESYAELDVLFLHTDPVTQFLLQSGRTLFKGMKFEELCRLQLDIETYSTPPYRFSNASRAGDRIILIALSDSTGWQHLIDGKKLSEHDMLLELVHIIKEKDPDVIEGHNIFNFDLPYLQKRCELNKVAFAVGRDGSPPRVFDSRTSFAERTFEYTVAEIAGRHIIDTMILVQNYDMSRRTMESYGLKYAAQYFGLTSPSRTYIKGDKISWHWDNDVKPLMEYALDDVIETRKLSEQLSGTSFYLTQMLPFAYGLAARIGSASKIESLMVREYLRLKHSLPRPSEGTQTTGGYTDIFVTGILGPILHVDVESLYPSIMISRGIAPASDVKGIFTELLKVITAMRLETKRKMRGTPDSQERSRLDAMQSSLKILINSFYGYLGYTRGLFNDFAKADAVTQTGQALLRQMITYIQSQGGKVIEVDTDGIFFVPPESVRGEEDENTFVDQLSRQMPEGISVVVDGRYRKMLSYKKKNYALLGYDNKITVKGSSLISRSMERFGRAYVHRCIDYLLTNDFDGLHNLYTHLRSDILGHKLSVREFARTETLKDAIIDYLNDVNAGKRNRSAAYEVAQAPGRQYKKGDSVSYYITGSEANPRSFESCKHVDQWDPNFPDENTNYYLRRLDEFSEKFRDFFEPKHYRAIFSADDLFPFSAQGITAITRDVLAKGEPDEPGSLPVEPGIWIEE